jgi:hypothetical protein
MSGPSTPASNTMSVFQYNTGARTRNVVNIAGVGTSGTKAIEVTAATETELGNAPDKADQGFANFRRQRYLHIQAKLAGGTVQAADEVNLYVWLYNSMSGIWTRAQVHDQQAGAGNIDLKLNLKGNAAQSIYYILDIKGAERVYIQAKNFNDAGGSDLEIPVYLGVNSF